MEGIATDTPCKKASQPHLAASLRSSHPKMTVSPVDEGDDMVLVPFQWGSGGFGRQGGVSKVYRVDRGLRLLAGVGTRVKKKAASETNVAVHNKFHGQAQSRLA